MICYIGTLEYQLSDFQLRLIDMSIHILHIFVYTIYFLIGIKYLKYYKKMDLIFMGPIIQDYLIKEML